MRAQDFKHNLPVYTEREELANFVTHAIGAVFAVAASVYALFASASRGNVGTVICMLIYGASLINLFVSSTLYHCSGKNEALRRRLQKADHLSISILIAGSVTGIIGAALPTPGGYYVIAFVWLLSITACILNLLSLKAFRAPAMACYIGGGWAPLLVVEQLFDIVGWSGIWLMLAGGLFCMLGLIIFYPIKKEFMHAIWHCFVLAGVVVHFVCIVVYIL